MVFCACVRRKTAVWSMGLRGRVCWWVIPVASGVSSAVRRVD